MKAVVIRKKNKATARSKSNQDEYALILEYQKISTVIV